MIQKLFIGNLPYTATEEELKEAFGTAGEVVSVSIVADRQSRRSKGFAFIEMANEEAGKAAIAKLHGAEYAGRVISVDIAKPMEPRAPRDGAKAKDAPAAASAPTAPAAAPAAATADAIAEGGNTGGSESTPA